MVNRRFAHCRLQYLVKQTCQVPVSRIAPANALEGYPVCRQAFLKIMGISPSRLVRTRQVFRGVDGRAWGFLAAIFAVFAYISLYFSLVGFMVRIELTLTRLGSIGRASACASASITSFLERVYWSMGETLPHALLNSN